LSHKKEIAGYRDNDFAEEIFLRPKKSFFEVNILTPKEKSWICMTFFEPVLG